MRSGIFILCLAAAMPASAVTVAGLRQQLAGGAHATIIDIRAPVLFAEGHIPGAINVPASLCPQKSLPPLGNVIVCGAGLGDTTTADAATALSAKPGIKAEILEGGYAAWQSAHAPDTRTPGLKPESLHYISYSELKSAVVGDVLLVDLRKQPSPKLVAAPGSGPATAALPLTDLAQEFPGMRLARNVPAPETTDSSAATGSGTPPFLVLIDNGDGAAEAMARRLKASGTQRYAILAGGELALARHGEPGLQRAGAKPTLQVKRPAPEGATQ